MALNKEKSFVNNVITVVSSDVITITEDKLENILNKNVSRIKKSKDIVTSLGLSISLYSLVCQTSLNGFWGFSGETIRGFFLLSLVVSIFYLIKTFINILFYSITSNDIIREIKSYSNSKYQKSWSDIWTDIKSKLCVSKHST